MRTYLPTWLVLAAVLCASCGPARAYHDGGPPDADATAAAADPIARRSTAPVRAAQEKPRLLVLADIGGDPDDMQSLRRLLLYASEFRVTGLVATAVRVRNEADRPVTRPDLMHEIVNDYAAAFPSLRGHDGEYPHPDTLRARIRSGSPDRGLRHLGTGRSTPGSDHIIAAVDAASATDPVHVSIWGGAHDLAQALHDVRATRGARAVEEFLSRIRVYAIADQDAWNGERGTGEWIFEHFPTLRYVESGPPGMDRLAAAFRGMYQNDSRDGDTPPVELVRSEVVPLVLERWVEENVRTGHGPLGAGYPLVGQNPRTPRNARGVKEGDTPAWFFFLPNGLSDPAHPSFGGWGGRFVQQAAGRFVDAEDEHWSGTADPATRRKWTVARWREAYQNDFAARMDRAVRPFSEVNHNPAAVVGGDASRRVIERRVAPGDRVRLDASGSRDPDGDRLSYWWYVYAEPSRYGGRVAIDGADAPAAVIHVPADAAGHEIHVILEVVDDGAPRLTGYRRVVLRVAGAVR